MGAEQNKQVVRRFWDELIVAGDVEHADELLAPGYVNQIVEGLSSEVGPPGDAAGLKAAIATFQSATREVRLEVDAVAAEGDAVFARFTLSTTLRDGTTAKSRALAYYQLADGKITMNDVMTVPA